MSCIHIKVIRFDPLAPVKKTTLLLPVISYDEYLELICKKTDFNVYESIHKQHFG